MSKTKTDVKTEVLLVEVDVTTHTTVRGRVKITVPVGLRPEEIQDAVRADFDGDEGRPGSCWYMLEDKYGIYGESEDLDRVGASIREATE